MNEEKTNRFIIDPELEEEKIEDEEKEEDDEFFDDFYEQKEEPVVVLEEFEEEPENEYEVSQNIQGMINKILNIDHLDPVFIQVDRTKTKEELEIEEQERLKEEEIRKRKELQGEIDEIISKTAPEATFISNILDTLEEKDNSILYRYGEDYTKKTFVTNPAIGRDEEIKQLVLTLLTPEKSAILIGKPGIGKTSIVEGLAYRIQRDLVPDALKGYSIVNIKTPSLVGTLSNGETRLQTLIDELKKLDKIILFIDEIHMLIGATNDSAMDFANMFKEGLGRGQVKVIGATTTDEYQRYILRDKAFVRRFQSIDVKEPNREHTIKILMGTLPKIEKETGCKLKYTPFIQSEIMSFIVDITSEFKRIYGIGSRYPDICLTLLKEAFSQAIFQNKDTVNIFDVRNAIKNSKNIYPDVITKELVNFDIKFEKIITEEKENQ